MFRGVLFLFAFSLLGVAAGEGGDPSPEVSNETLNELHRLSVEVTPDEPLTPAQVAKELGELQSNPDLELKRATGIAIRTLMLGHNGSLHSMLKTMGTRLGMEGDERSYRMRVYGSSIPNAHIEVDRMNKEYEIGVNFGLLALASNQDELAGVIAHELTHSNPKQGPAGAGDPEIETILEEMGASRGLEPAQREEIRADLGAIDRLIRAGYNPWAYFDILKRLEKWENNLAGAKLAKKVKGDAYQATHPYLSLRTTAIKSYILRRSKRQDLSKHTEKKEPFSTSVDLLRLRLYAFNLPVNVALNKWTQRGLIAFLGWQAASALGLTDFATYNSAMSATGDFLSPALEKTAEGLDWAGGKAFNFLDAIHGAASKAIEMTPESARTWLWRATKYALGPYAAYRIGRATMNRHLEEDYGFYEYIGSQRDRKKFEESFDELLKAGLKGTPKANAEFLTSLLGGIRSALNEMQGAYNLAGFMLHDLSAWSGLSREKDKQLSLVTKLLEMLAQEMEKMPAIEQAKIRERRELEPPPFVLERAPARRALSKIMGVEKSERPFYPPGEDFSLKEKLRTLEAADRCLSGCSPHEAVRVLVALTDFRMRDTAATLFERRGRELIDFTYSAQNTDPELGAKLQSAYLILRDDSSLRERTQSQTEHFDKIVTSARLAARSQGLSHRLGTFALAAAIPPKPTKFPFYYVTDYIPEGVSDLFKLKSWLDAADTRALEKHLTSHFKTVVEVKNYLDKELLARNVPLNILAPGLNKILVAHPEWFKTRTDFEAAIAGEYFWPRFSQDATAMGELEGELMKRVDQSRAKFPEVWKYDPASSERLHLVILGRLEAMGMTPKTMVEKVDLWRALATRGVTSRTDAMFTEAYNEVTDENQRKRLEKGAMDGYVWEQDVRAKIAEREVRELPAFNKLLVETDTLKRGALLAIVLNHTSNQFPEKGIRYRDLLEKISREIRSTEHESGIIQKAKNLNHGGNGERSQDSGIRAMSEVLQQAHQWSRQNQFDLILYLRGDIEATPKIQSAFRTLGPERAQRMFSLLPVEARAALFDAFLDSPDGLLPKVDAKGGWAKTIIDHLMKDASPKAREVGGQLLEAFLHSLQETGNKPLQSLVLSYLLAMEKGENGSPGRVLKNVLEVFGGTGVKIGQFLVASELLPPEETKILRELQERAKIPERESIYKDLREIAHGQGLPQLSLKDLLGAASMKYASLATDKDTNKDWVVKVLRLDAVAHSTTEFNQLDAMTKYLTVQHGAKYGVFRAIVKASRAAVERELSMKDAQGKDQSASLNGEVERSRLAARHIYSGQSEPGIEVRVPQEVSPFPRLGLSEFAPGSSIFDLEPEHQARAARKILTMEGGNLFKPLLGDGEVLHFDPDRHGGNYRVEVKADGGMVLTPIDHGQVQTISRGQREEVFQMFALAQIMKETGATEWAANELAKALKLDAAQRTKVKRALSAYFPSSDLREVTAYYSVLAALDDAGIAKEIVYFDFLRAIITLNQYEALNQDATAKTPRHHLENEARARVDSLLPGMTLTAAEKLKIGYDRWKNPKPCAATFAAAAR